jgi:hypothetical protein
MKSPLNGTAGSFRIPDRVRLFSKLMRDPSMNRSGFGGEAAGGAEVEEGGGGSSARGGGFQSEGDRGGMATSVHWAGIEMDLSMSIREYRSARSSLNRRACE